MNKQEAIEAMRSGKWVKHSSFSKEEKITMDGNTIIDEKGYRFDDDFWAYRTHPGFNDGWETVEKGADKMNREILFRSWNKVEKKFYYFKDGRYYSDPECKHCVSERICTEFSWNNAQESTGLTDKNGKGVFEGDNCRLRNSKDLASVVFSYNYVGGWTLSVDNKNFLSIALHAHEIEIIGNVYEEASCSTEN
jgi:hypothetical protein